MTNKALDTQLLQYLHALEKSQQLAALNYVKNLLKRPKKSNKNKDLLALAGTISPKDLKIMEKAIHEGCENIDEDSWK